MMQTRPRSLSSMLPRGSSANGLTAPLLCKHYLPDTDSAWPLDSSRTPACRSPSLVLLTHAPRLDINMVQALARNNGFTPLKTANPLRNGLSGRGSSSIERRLDYPQREHAGAAARFCICYRKSRLPTLTVRTSYGQAKTRKEEEGNVGVEPVPLPPPVKNHYGLNALVLLNDFSFSFPFLSCFFYNSKLIGSHGTSSNSYDSQEVIRLLYLFLLHTCTFVDSLLTHMDNDSVVTPV
jgi:hypothetical protein